MQAAGFDLAGLRLYLERRWEDIVQLFVQHVVISLVAIAIALVIGVGLGMLVWDRPVARSLSIAAAGVFLTIPSFALLGLLLPIFGLGTKSVLPALVCYSLLPILRNTVVGLREVPPAVVEAARGVGMSPTSVLLRIQLPMAWPVILTGARVASQLTVGIAAIAAYVSGPGLGELIFSGLSSLGSRNSLNQALTGTVGVIIVALLLDTFFTLVRRLTTSKGLHA